MPLPALAAVAKAAAPMIKKAALKAAKKKAVSTAVNAMQPKEEEQKQMRKGGRKPGAAQDAVSKALKNRATNQDFKSKANKLRSDRMSEKASTTKNKAVRKLREEVAAKRADQARGNEAKSERSAKAANFAAKRGELARNRASNKAAKAEIRAKYENGGKVGDPKKKRDGSKVTKAYTGNQPFTSDEIRSATRGKGKMTAGEKKRLQKEVLNSLLTPADKAPQKMRRLGVKKLGADKSDLEARNRGLKI